MPVIMHFENETPAYCTIALPPDTLIAIITRQQSEGQLNSTPQNPMTLSVTLTFSSDLYNTYIGHCLESA